MKTSQYLIAARDNFLKSKGIYSLKNFTQDQINDLAEEFSQLTDIQALFEGIDIVNAENGFSDFSFKNVMSQLSGGVSTLFNPNVSLKDKGKNLITGGVYGTLSENEVVNPAKPGQAALDQLEQLQNQQSGGKTNFASDAWSELPVEPKKILGMPLPVAIGAGAVVLIILIVVIYKLVKK